jgi:iron-regulated transporter 1
MAEAAQSGSARSIREMELGEDGVAEGRVEIGTPRARGGGGSSSTGNPPPHAPARGAGSGRKAEGPWRQLVDGWRTFFESTVFSASFGYCLLYLTVLDNGTLMTQWLIRENVDAGLVGASRGVGALFGILGTLVYPRLVASRCVARGGDGGALERGGVVTLWLFLCTVAPAGLVVALASGPAEELPLGPAPGAARIRDAVSGRGGAYAMMALVALARVWLWAFDVGHCQVMQERVPEASRGVVSGCQTALYQLMWMALAVLGIVFSDPDQFWALALISVLSVLAAAVVYTLWARRSLERLRGGRSGSVQDRYEALVVDINDL